MTKICTLILNENTIDDYSIKVSTGLKNVFNKGALNKCKIIYTANLEKDESNEWLNLKIIYNGRIQYLEDSIFGYVENYWHFYDETLTLTNVASTQEHCGIKPEITFHNIDIGNININALNQLEVTFVYNITIDNIFEQDIVDIALTQEKKD